MTLTGNHEEQVTVRKPDGRTFKMRIFGTGDTRWSSRGVVLRSDETAPWRFQTEDRDGYEIVE